MNSLELNDLVDKYYNKYILDATIIGFDGLLKIDGFGSKIRQKIRNKIYGKYGKDILIKIYRSRLAKCGGIAFSKNNPTRSQKTINKQKKSLKKYWKNNNVRKSQNRHLIKEYCLPNAHSPLSNLKRTTSRRHGAGWFPHSAKTKLKMSAIFLKKWQAGDYDNRAPTLKSKGQLELISILKNMGYYIVDEYRINAKPFDAFIPNLRILFEFNGTYWHLDPRIYEPMYWDKLRKMYAYEIWRKDMLKSTEALRLGYRVIIIWQNDWDSNKNKEQYLQELINGKSK